MNYKYFFTDKYIIYYIALLLNLLILRVCLPFSEYIFIGLSILLLPLFAFNYKKILSGLLYWKTFKFSFSLILLVVLFIISFIVSKQYTFLTIREFAIAVFAIAYLTIGFIFINKNTHFKIFIKHFIKQLIFITTIAAILGIIKLALEFYGIEFSFLLNPRYPVGSSLKSDHNFFALSMIFGFIMLVNWLYNNKLKNFTKYNFILLIYSISIVFSSSRRAIILLILIHFLLFLYAIYNLIKKKGLPKLGHYLILAFVFAVITLFSLYSLRNSNIINFRNKQKITIYLNDYRSIIVKNSKLEDTYKLIWETDYLKSYKSTKNNNSKIISDTIISNFENSNLWANWFMLKSKILKIHKNSIFELKGFHPAACIKQLLVLDSIEKPIEFSINVKVKKWHNISLKIDTIGNTKIQILIFCAGKSINKPGHLYVNNIQFIRGNKQNLNTTKNLLLELNSLKLPQAKQIISKDISVNISEILWTSYFDYSDSLNYNSKDIFYTYSDSLRQTINKEIIIPESQFYTYLATVLAYSSAKTVQRIAIRNKTAKNYIYSYYTSNTYNNIWQDCKLTFYAEKNDTINLQGISNNNKTSRLVLWKDYSLKGYIENHKESVNKIDSIDSKILSNLYNTSSENAKKEKLKNEQLKQLKQNKNRLLSARTDRWIYAIELYNEYTVFEKIFGGGFDYLYKFKDEFQKRSKQEFDYPHNIFLSTLLYSGLFGLAVLIFVLGKVVYLYIKYKQFVLLISFLLTLSFVLFSSNSIFELPLIVGFIILPYLQHLIVKKEQIIN